MAAMRQDVGAETVWKNRIHTRSGLVRFFQTVYAQQIDASRPFLFRILGLIGKWHQKNPSNPEFEDSA
jgi:hypothetical protein